MIHQQLGAERTLQEHNIPDLVERLPADVPGAHVVTASMLQTAFEQGLNIVDQCIPVDGIDRVESIDRIRCPVLAVVIVGADHHSSNPTLRERRFQLRAEVGLACCGGAGDTDQQGRSVHQPRQISTPSSLRSAPSALVHSEPMARMT